MHCIRLFLTPSDVASPTTLTTNGQMASLNLLSKEFPTAFCKSKVMIIVASSAATHVALSLCLICDGGRIPLLLNFEALGMLP